MTELRGESNGAARHRVLVLLEKALYSEGYNDVFTDHTNDDGVAEGVRLYRFAVERTVDRKGYRHVREPFLIASDDTGYTAEPRIKITIELEMEDNTVPDLLQLVEVLNNRQLIAKRESLQAAVADAQARSVKAQDDYVAAKTLLDKLDGKTGGG